MTQAAYGKVRVLFVCTHNSARSQMAEELLEQLGGGRFEALSAGTEPGQVHPLAARVMAEAGFDISDHRSKSAESLLDQHFDWVITVCDSAKETCPYFPHAGARAHWSFPDPSAATGSEEERMARFREVRDAIRERVARFVAQVTGGG